MFTGIVERTARVAALEDRPGSRRITLELAEEKPFPPWRAAVLGESIALDGVCLTVVAARGGPGGELVSFEAVPETLRRTTLGAFHPGVRVNVERSLRVGDLFGGHYVTGHVDGIATVRARRPEGDQILFEIQSSAEVVAQMIPKGSVAVDGISLTIVDVNRTANAFTFAAIPHTVSWTTLSARVPGSRVNVETDAFGKWVLHALESLRGSVPGAAGGGSDERLRSLLAEGGWGEPS